MGFGGGSAPSSIAGSSDVYLSNPANGQTLVYDSAQLKWENQTPGASSVPGMVYFDSYFSGSTDDAKIASMNSYFQSLSAGSPRPTVVFDSRQYNFSTAIVL